MTMLMIILGLFVMLHLIIGVYDFSFFRIPNVLLVCLLVLYGIFAPFYLDMTAFVESLFIFAAMLIICSVLYAFRFLGAGDAKYFAVAAIWMGKYEVLSFVFLVSLIGALLGLLFLAFGAYFEKFSNLAGSKIQKAEERCPALQKVWMGSEIGAKHGNKEAVPAKSIPYGVAIALGSILVRVIL